MIYRKMTKFYLGFVTFNACKVMLKRVQHFNIFRGVKLLLFFMVKNMLNRKFKIIMIITGNGVT